MKKPTLKIRHAHARERTHSPHGIKSMAQQHFKDECDINNIMRKYEKDGIVTHRAKYMGNYDDFTVMPDFKTAMDTMHDAHEMFLTLPAAIREQFNNEPGNFVEFATDECNLPELHKMGLTHPDYKPPEVAKPKRAQAAENPSESVSETPDQNAS